MTATVQKWGNSIAVRLPKAVAQAAFLSEGSAVMIEAKDGRILLTPLHKPVYRLANLVRGITRKNRHRLIEMGKPRGREVW